MDPDGYLLIFSEELGEESHDFHRNLFQGGEHNAVISIYRNSLV